MKLQDLFIKSCSKALTLQLSNGAMPSGHNGPHGDIETSVRSTSHWLISFIKAFNLSGDVRFRNAAIDCLQFLQSDFARPMKASFWHRRNKGKDLSNGLIGQAWTIEALIYAFKFFGDDKVLSLAQEVFELHPYHHEVCAWKIVNVDGSIKGVDITFNHQLWFAAIGCELLSLISSSSNCAVDHFLDHLGDGLRTYSDGIICHYQHGYGYPRGIRVILGASLKSIENTLFRNERIYLHSIGYHYFNVYAMYIIHLHKPDLSFFKSKRFDRILSAHKTRSFRSDLLKSEFGFPYNPPGIEIAVSVQMAKESPETIQSYQKFWLDKQYSETYDFEKFMMTKGTPDPVVSSSRIYEMYRLSNFNHDIEIV